MTAARPVVSCVIPVWNAERFLSEAIESVVRQTDADWELLLVDDGSTDSSPVLVDAAVRSDPVRIRHLRHPGGANRGVSATRNLGIRHAEGRYVAFLDADDVWLPAKLHEQVAILEAHPEAAMVYGRTVIWRSWATDGTGPSVDEVSDLRIEADRVIDAPRLVTLFLRDETAACTVDSVLVRRSVLDEVGAFEESFPDLYEDYVLWIKVMVRWPIYVSSSVWDRYRQHDGNSYLRAEREGRFSRTRPNPGTAIYLRWVAYHLSVTGVSDRQTWRVLERRLRPYRHPVSHSALGPGVGLLRRGAAYSLRRLVGRRRWEGMRRSRWVTGVPPTGEAR